MRLKQSTVSTLAVRPGLFLWPLPVNQDDWIDQYLPFKQSDVWKVKLESAGYRVITDPIDIK